MRMIRWMTMLALTVASLPLNTARAIPAFARKYNMNCSGCHAPAVPRLNATGFAFKWAGYRMPDEIGENQEIKNWSDVVAARVGFRYNLAKTESKPVNGNSFAASSQSLYASAAIGTAFGAFAEFGGSTVNEMVYGVWGNAKQYGGVRVGNEHWLQQGVVAFDQATGINSLTVLNKALTQGGIPFAFSAGETGVEAFYVARKNRLSFEVLNGVDKTGTPVTTGSPTTKDIAVTDQLMYDNKGSGVTAMAYYGSIPKVDTLVNKQTSHFTRMAISANKILNKLEVSGGYAYGKDNDLPVGTHFASNSITGSGFWGYLGYTLPNDLTAYGRYEYMNTNQDIANSGNVRYVLGSVLPVNMPEYMRLAAEGTLDDPRATNALKSYTFSLQAFLTF